MKPLSKSASRAGRDHLLAGYTRGDVLRILRMKASQLSDWERHGLIHKKETYHFSDLSQLRVLRELRATRMPARNIRASVVAMQRYSGVGNALIEASAVRRGQHLNFRHAGALIDPLTQQLAFDFELGGQDAIGMVRGDRALNPTRVLAEVQDMFQRAVQLEEDSTTVDQAAALYRDILSLRPEHAPASINLGTIHYNRREFERAEALYRQATSVDPEYALAFFDLGNVLDETMHLDAAIAAYQRAVALVPQYADAHYNLALAYERQGERRRALRHWLIYVRLDPIGPWSSHAKCQAKNILSSERLSIVSRRGTLVTIAG